MYKNGFGINKTKPTNQPTKPNQSYMALNISI